MYNKPIDLSEVYTMLNEWLSKRGNKKLLAEKLGVSVAFITLIANGKKNIPIEQLRRIQEVTGIYPRDLRPDVWEIFK